MNEELDQDYPYDDEDAEDCWRCHGDGGWHDCGEDCCPCADPEAFDEHWIVCDECARKECVMSDESVTPAAVPAAARQEETWADVSERGILRDGEDCMLGSQCGQASMFHRKSDGRVCCDFCHRPWAKATEAAAAPPPLDLEPIKALQDAHPYAARVAITRLVAEVERLRALHAATPSSVDRAAMLQLVQRVRETFDPGGNLPEDCAEWSDQHDAAIDALVNGIGQLLNEVDRSAPPHAATEGARQPLKEVIEREFDEVLWASGTRSFDRVRAAARDAILAVVPPVVAEGALRALVEQLDGLGVEMGDDGAWHQNCGTNVSGGRILKYANELRRIQMALAALLPARPASVKET